MTSWFEPRTGADLSGVRVHTGDTAAAVADGVDALAVTVGEDIYFAAGRFDTRSHQGRALLAHELGHATSHAGANERDAQSVADAALQDRPRPASVPRGRGSRRPGRQAAPAATAGGGQRALARIHSLLSTGLFDWSVSDAEATEVLTILERLPPAELVNTVSLMRFSGDWSTFRRNLPQALIPRLYVLDEHLDRHQGYLLAGDTVEVEGGTGRTPRPDFDVQLPVTAAGVSPPHVPDAVAVAGALPQQAVDAIAQAYVRGLVYVTPQIRLVVIARGAAYGAFAGATPGRVWYTSTPIPVGAAEQARRDRQAAFLSYVSTVHPSSDLEITALGRYLNFVEDNATSQQLAAIAPHELWAQKLREASEAARPSAELQHEQDWQRFIDRRRAELATVSERDERERLTTALNQLVWWYASHGSAGDVGTRYGTFLADATRQSIEARMRAAEERQRDAAQHADTEASVTRFDDYLALAMRIRAKGREHLPYLIQLPSQGIDILVTDDPARRHVLEDLAAALMDYALAHVGDPGFGRQHPEFVLHDLLRGGFRARLDWADTQPLTHEVFDRNEIDPERAAWAFGKTIATGLFVLGAAGLAVGAGIISAPVAAVALGALAVGGAIGSYLERRDEIEAAHAYVPIPMTILASMGDAIGVSQIIESITGQRLNLETPLGSARRSDAAGEGVGSLFLLLTGSEAFRRGRLLGETTRPAILPSGPEGGRTPPPPRTPLELPQPSVEPGPLEQAARATVPADERVGFDDWMAEIRQRGDPEQVLGRMSEQQRARQVSGQSQRRSALLARAMRREWAARRSADDPLRPLLRHVETRDGVVLRYQSRAPVEADVAFGRRLAAESGEPVELFGDNASGTDYPGIDGTIGDPPRPLQLKRSSVAADPDHVRWSAEEALVSAERNSYGHVEVHIDAPGATQEQVRTAWNGPSRDPANPRRAVFAGRSVARYVVHCSDGRLVFEPPTTNLPGVRIPLPGSADDEERRTSAPAAGGR